MKNGFKNPVWYSPKNPSKEYPSPFNFNQRVRGKGNKNEIESGANLQSTLRKQPMQLKIQRPHSIWHRPQAPPSQFYSLSLAPSLYVATWIDCTGFNSWDPWVKTMKRPSDSTNTGSSTASKSIVEKQPLEQYKSIMQIPKVSSEHIQPSNHIK